MACKATQLINPQLCAGWEREPYSIILPSSRVINNAKSIDLFVGILSGLLILITILFGINIATELGSSKGTVNNFFANECNFHAVADDVEQIKASIISIFYIILLQIQHHIIASRTGRPEHSPRGKMALEKLFRQIGYEIFIFNCGKEIETPERFGQKFRQIQFSLGIFPKRRKFHWICSKRFSQLVKTCKTTSVALLIFIADGRYIIKYYLSWIFQKIQSVFYKICKNLHFHSRSSFWIIGKFVEEFDTIRKTSLFFGKLFCFVERFIEMENFRVAKFLHFLIFLRKPDFCRR